MTSWLRFFQTNESARATTTKTALTRLRELLVKHLPDSDEEMLEVTAAIAGLVATIAYADRELHEKEIEQASKELSRIHSLESSGANAICSLLREDIKDLVSVGDQGWTRMLRETTERKERIEVLDVLVEIAAVDGSIALSEVSELRRLTTALGLSQDEYNALQARHRDKLSLIER